MKESHVRGRFDLKDGTNGGLRGGSSRRQGGTERLNGKGILLIAGPMSFAPGFAFSSVEFRSISAYMKSHSILTPMIAAAVETTASQLRAA